MTWKSRLLTVCLALAAAPSAFGELMVSIGNSTIQQGQSNATFSVTLASSDGSPIGVNSFGFEFLIIPINNAPAELMFAVSQPQPFLDPTYLFDNNSADQGYVSLGNVSQTNTPNDTYSGSDGTADGTNVTVSSLTGSKLLTNIEVSLSPLYLQTAGTFEVVLLPSSYAGAPASASPNTFFTAADASNPNGYDQLPFTSNVGIITVSTVIPEPPSILLLATGAIVPFVLLLARRAGRGSNR
jgi:hypothetical protein